MRRAFLLEQFEAEAPLSLQTLDALPDDRLDWRPHPRSLSIGRLAMHVAALPGWVPLLLEDAYDMGVGGGGPEVPTSKHDVLDKFTRSLERGRSALVSQTEAQLEAPWTLLRDGHVVATMTRGEAIARYVLRHAAHHRGQLTVYLRLRDIPVPPLFGDSADRRLLPPGLMS